MRQPLLKRDTFTVEAVQQNNVRNGTAALLQAYLKYGLTPTKPMPAAFMYALRKRQESSVTAIASGTEWIVPTTIGGQTLNMLFDTGSSDLWVFSTLLPGTSQIGHGVYNSTASVTYKALSGYTWEILYADYSSAKGVVGNDTVTVGGITVTNQAVELATKVTDGFVSSSIDGIMGLGCDTANTSPVRSKNFFTNAIPSLAKPLFCAYLPRSRDGAYDFSYINSTRHTGAIHYASVNGRNGYWEFPSTSFKVGSTTYRSSGTGIADIGTSLILMSDLVVDTYYSQVQGAQYVADAGAWLFPCSSALPTLSFRIGLTAYATIPSSLLNLAIAIDPADPTNFNTCFGSLQSVGSGSQAIYGQMFFDAYYAVFQDSPRLFGFAPLK